MKLLFCQLRNHGDIIRIFPLLDAIKFSHPDWLIGFTCYPEMVDTCKLSPSIDMVFPQAKFMPVTNTEGNTRILDCNILRNTVSRVRSEQFDVYIDLHGVFQSALFGALCGITTRLGRSNETAKDGADMFYTDICTIKSHEINRMERHFVVFNHLFPEIRPILPSRPDGKDIVIFPGSSKAGILKRWGLERYIMLGNSLNIKENVKFILGPDEWDMGIELQQKSVCLVEFCSSWAQINGELKSSKLAIGNDGAYIHMAVWNGVPSIMICGPLSPIINGIWKYGRGETLYMDKPCHCENPWGGVCQLNHDCMKQISVEQVLASAERCLTNGNASQ